jgi:hypothetical protein
MGDFERREFRFADNFILEWGDLIILSPIAISKGTPTSMHTPYCSSIPCCHA